MAYCEQKIATDLSSPCDNAYFGGMSQKAYLINKSDWEAATITKTGNVISDLSLTTGAYAYACVVRSKKPYNGSNTALVSSDVANKFTHTINLTFENDGATFRANVVDKMANGKFVLIVEHDWNDATGNSKFQVYGSEKGLVQSEGTIEEGSDPEGWSMVLTEENVPSSGIYLFKTSVAATRTLLEGLLNE